MITYHGWGKLDSLVHTDRNAEASESTVIYTYKRRMDKNPAMELIVAVIIHRMDNEPWSDEELLAIKELEILEITQSGSVLGVNITIYNGERYEVDFKTSMVNERVS